MYKLLLVDDEEDVREGLIQEIEWHKYGFEVVGAAENGKEALDIIEKSVPDVLITDIKMPFMDGLQLSEAVKMGFPTVKVIILTGFEEFEFAQKAIKLGIMEYLLKPFSSDELIQILSRVKSQIDEEIARAEDAQALLKHYRESIPVLREKFLALLIAGKLTEPEIRGKIKSYVLPLEGAGYIASIISTDYSAAESTDGALDSLQLQNEILFTRFEKRELMNIAVLQIAEEVTGKYNIGTTFLYNDHVVIIAASKSGNREEHIDRTAAALEEVRQMIRRYLKYTFTIGMGSYCNDLTQLHTSYRDATAALDYSIVMGKNKIIWIEDIESKACDRVVFDEAMERALTSCVKLGTEKEINETVDRIFESLVDTRASVKVYQIFLLEMLTAILKAASDTNVEAVDIFDQHYNIFVELDKFTDILDVRNWMKEICIKVMTYITKNRQDTYRLLAEQAKEYIEANYFDQELTVNKLCDFLHVSPAKLSMIFKKEYKTTVINYLTQVRMDTAKKLLRSTDMKFFEIASEVGYSEANYFSYCFKKNLGISPSEYRKNFI